MEGCDCEYRSRCSVLLNSTNCNLDGKDGRIDAGAEFTPIVKTEENG